MKTKFLKLVLPVMAFVMAGILAFASENKATAEAPLATTGYIWQSGVCTSNTKICNEIGTTPCTTSLGAQIFRNATVCTDMLFHRP